MQLNGIAHIQLTVTDASRSVPFWERLLHLFEMKTLMKNESMVYCIGSRTGVMVREAPAEKRGARFDQEQVGLHHICFRAREREQVDEIHRFVTEELGANVVHAPEEGAWAPGYYSVLFEDPDGIRIEVNFVPGRGHLDRLEGS